MKVSVVIPTFCRVQLLCEAIDTVLLQGVDETEIIVVDDGSTDDTEVRLRTYGRRIKYVKQQSQGLRAARNTGLSLAIGQYVALLDGDDWWMPEKLAMQVAVLDRLPEVRGVYTNLFDSSCSSARNLASQSRREVR